MSTQFSLSHKENVLQALKTVHNVLMDIYVAPSIEIIETDELRKIDSFEVKVSYLAFNQDSFMGRDGQSKMTKMIVDRIECYILGYLEACKSRAGSGNY